MIVPVEEGVILTGRGLLTLAGTKVETKVLSRFGFNLGEKAAFKGSGTLNYEHHGMEFLDDGARMVEQPTQYHQKELRANYQELSMGVPHIYQRPHCRSRMLLVWTFRFLIPLPVIYRIQLWVED